jgi:hypothetical protein
MKKAVLSTLVTVVLCVGQAPIVRAETAVTPTLQHILITEIQTGGTTDATEEFVEIYNPNEDPINIAGWQLQYRAASGTSAQTWPGSSTKATVTCPAGSPADCATTIQPHGRIVFTRTIANIAGAIPMSGGFSDTGGEIRLIQPGTTVTVQDFVGYGTAADAEGGSAAAAPNGGSSIKRKITDDGLPIDTNNNAADFVAACGNPTPGIEDSSYMPRASGCVAPPTEPTSTDPSQSDPTDTPAEPIDGTDTGGSENPTTTLTYLPILITELLPDPAAPQQDSNDEFIELYNPNDTAVTLKDYRLQTGSDYRYTYTLGDTPLGPHMYLAIPSAVSKLSLVNSGSGVRLMDPNNSTVSEVTYGEAKVGQTWMQDGAGWQWTLSPTPGAANILTLPAPKTTATTTTTAKKKVATPTTTKTAMAKVTVPKATAAKKATTTKSSPTTQQAVAQSPQYWLLVPIGALAAGYAIYEYRQDISKITRKSWAAFTGNKMPAGATTEED